MFSGFWLDAYLRAFDGGSELIPAVHPHTDMAIYSVLGTVLSHGFVLSGFLPTHLAFPVVASTAHGPMVAIPDTIIVQSFSDYLSSYDSTVIQEALVLASNLQLKKFADDQLSQLINILSLLGCREMPSPTNLKCLIVEVARHELLIKPLGALYALRSGVRDELSDFLDFVTGSSVLVAKYISISFNSLSGLSRRPISHTCSNALELPTTYFTYPELVQELVAVLTSKVMWPMDTL